MFSWYNLILKLQLPELLQESQNDEKSTVLECLVMALAKGRFSKIVEKNFQP